MTTKISRVPRAVLLFSALLISLLPVCPSFAQTPQEGGLTLDFFRQQPPLSEPDLDFYLKLLEATRDPRVAEKAADELMEANGVSFERFMFISTKVSNGLTLHDSPASEADVVDRYDGIKEVLPTEAEQALIDERHDEIVKALKQR
jgi:hypothetical protein